MKKNILSRRDFLSSAAALAAFTIVPRHVLGGEGFTAPSQKLNIATIGFGGMGCNNTMQCLSENIVALCDVDQDINRGKEVRKACPNAKLYVDYKEMLDKEKNIDAVIIATPDHSHAIIALECMRRGKHVYVQKPLTRTVAEARMLTQAAKKYKVITQMGNQGRSSEGARLICEWIRDGAIGTVSEVQAWTSRPLWNQPVQRPTEEQPVPATFDWDKWIGPVKMRPHNHIYYHGVWRAWQNFGTGALGDMACHVLDPAFWALNVKYPTSVEASFAKERKNDWNEVDISESFPKASIIHFTYPKREGFPELKLTWYDGGLMPERPAELEPGRRMGDSEGGVLFIGDKGKLMCGCYASNPRLIPETKMQAYKRPEKTLPRVNNIHEQSWIEAIKKGEQAPSNFDYAGPFTESVVMGNLALRCPEQKLYWDGENMKFTNNDAANALVYPEYREGYKLEI